MIGWQLVEKTPNPALDGNWKRSGVKQHVRVEAHNKCVYCGIHENFIGGINAFHKDHYKPKKRFSDLENKLSNIYYSCSICNIFKSDNWPNDPTDDHSLAAFPDPAIFDYNELFIVNWSEGRVKGLYVDSLYVENQLNLNRPQLIMTRQEYALHQRVDIVNTQFTELFPALLPTNSKVLQELLIAYQSTLHDLRTVVGKGDLIPRYEPEDTKGQ